MSSIYNLEPQPTASLILHTTLGDLSVELFAKQTPLASRNFLQLCLDGYYDGTIFHRLVPGFILQGGDPTGTGNGGESIYDGGAYGGDLDAWPLDQRRGRNAGPTGVNFKDESHSRLKFNRRGLLGMANDGRPDTNASQFFFTLDKAPELDGRNTLFGRIVGDTIYNLARMGESEVAEGSERPLYPIKITGVEILVNPFEDMKKRERVAARSQPSQAPTKPAKKKKAKGGKKLLSFGDEEGGGDEDVPVIKKAKFDTRIVMDLDDEEPAEAPMSKKPKSSIKKGQEEKTATTSIPVREPVADKTKPDTTTETIRRPSPPPPPREKEAPTKPTYDEFSPEPERPKKSALERANEEIAALKASMKRTVYDVEEPVKEVKKTALERLIPESSMRGRKRRRDGEGTMSNADLSAFEAFRSKLVESSSKAQQSNKNTSTKQTSSKRAEDDVQIRQEDTATASKAKNDENGDDADQDDEAALCDLHFIANCQSCRSWAGEEEEGGGKRKADNEATDSDDDDDTSWITHRLSFAADKLGKDLTYRKKAEEELIVIDPREKARTLKEEQRARRGEAGGGTGSGREWDQARDQARNAKLARASALAGRGAR
ncbi:Peptidyl-prolyl isomerase cwc27 [Diatrype stigma]|uniref:peptidylprolyl isomerase n=1 Tax=Diatrype stigma TaxID=117547 RepID=A0AAN9UYB8_9PEZI